MRGLQQLGKNRWKIILELGEDAEGRRIRRTPTFHGTKREAEAEKVRLLHKLQTGTFVDETRLTVAEYLHHWLDAKKGNVRPRTHARYAEIVNLHLIPALGSHKLKDLRPLHIENYYAAALSSGRRARKSKTVVVSVPKSGVDADEACEVASAIATKKPPPGLSARTVNHHATVLKSALKQAVRWQILVFNPADAVDKPRPV